MKIMFFVKGARDASEWPQVELPHITVGTYAHHYDHGAECSEKSELALHGFTADHARQLIEVLTPIAKRQKVIA